MTARPPQHSATVVVIGAGQAGLSAAFHLRRLGFESALEHPGSADRGLRTFVVLDAETAPGGAWQHRWESLRMATVNGIFDLPGFAKPPIDDDEPSRTAVPRYFADYEEQNDFPILRPVRVGSVRAVDDDPAGLLIVETIGGPPGEHGQPGAWLTHVVINATGTWGNPLRPSSPGSDVFLGRQLHTRDYVSLEEFRGRRVAVVGGGISAVQQLEEISRVAWTAWYTRREPVFLEGPFGQETGRDTIARVTADVEAGRPASSVVSYTGLFWTPYALAARDRGALERRPMFTALEPHGVREADGSFTSIDTVLWATGFRADLAHLDPLHLRNAAGGIRMRGTAVEADPRVQLVGFGASQSTVGANRAGRAAATAAAALLRP
ncbi:NAD(P)/FAD-dependent oxidoreductase [Herbiconiux sp. CPCC 203407]|uniref:NAD(P)/FAD-dependent oxidoreductase n=1 Tax=Herbiconiux oxytropis TaxID=2970915 RepID=A0AA41XIJ7_9MICO|nr:NAD(P)/FAD-dependent oxidoreductase [Herbiconiux oxytropis]MCS5722223.1 NAD(P)/FAD-dependent oxidoreductase [Herbiconiux oxytropis]MCS5727139.1 NAD(P)/FAD-dependent oxidoreductase [Herbiconiux oxytropis]